MPGSRLMIGSYLSNLPRRAGRLAGGWRAWQESAAAGRRYWLVATLFLFFDLCGGAELAEFLLRLMTRTRPLTAGEIALASRVFGPEAVDFAAVRVAQGGLLTPAFWLNKRRAFATWHTINMPSGRDKDLPLLIHELTHVYQYERVGSVYIFQGLSVQHLFGARAYHYGGPEALARAYAAGKHYCDYNREQQGMIAQHYCQRLLQGDDTEPYEPYIAELQAGRL